MRLFGLIEVYFAPKKSIFSKTVYKMPGQHPKGLGYLTPVQLRDALGEIILNLKRGNKAVMDKSDKWQGIHYEI